MVYTRTKGDRSSPVTYDSAIVGKGQVATCRSRQIVRTILFVNWCRFIFQGSVCNRANGWVVGGRLKIISRFPNGIRGDELRQAVETVALVNLSTNYASDYFTCSAP